MLTHALLRQRQLLVRNLKLLSFYLRPLEHETLPVTLKEYSILANVLCVMIAQLQEAAYVHRLTLIYDRTLSVHLACLCSYSIKAKR